ncbi:MAG: hypothetical protein KAI17_04590, partial [Thiotrichaceae bacterium]|nr:hypothetical protein [Thiotrichaceae bacterium]
VSAPVIADTPTVSEDTGFSGDDGGGTVTVTNTPSSITNTADCPLAFLGVPCLTAVEPQQEEEVQQEEEPAAEFEGQSFISGKNAVFERLLILLFKNNGVDINKVDGFNVVDNVFEIPGTDGVFTKFTIDLDKIPETMDDIQEASVTWALSSVEGIDNEDVLVLQFEVGENIVKVELQPVVHQPDDLVDLIKKMDGVFKVYSEEGWLFILLDNGFSISLHLGLSHLPVREPEQRAANDELEFDIPLNYDYESNDVNGDGVDDIIVIHNGIAQLMLIKPNH